MHVTEKEKIMQELYFYARLDTSSITITKLKNEKPLACRLFTEWTIN